jgi:hypothetical protein
VKTTRFFASAYGKNIEPTTICKNTANVKVRNKV